MIHRITLPAKSSDDLSWKQEICDAKAAQDSGKKILWSFDLGIDPVCSPLTDAATFSGQALAMMAFSKIFPQFAEATAGVVLAKSSLFRNLSEKDECEAMETLDEPFRTYLSAMTLFADYLHRLASFLPDDVRVQVQIDGGGGIEREILLSKERFRHIEVKEENRDATMGCVIPGDEFCVAEVREGLQEMLLWIEQQNIAHRCIPEALLNEEWAGLETLVFFAPAMTKLGERMAQGFIAAGGKVQYFETRNYGRN